MGNFEAKILKAIKKEPQYQCLDGLRDGVWHKVRTARSTESTKFFEFSFGPLFKGTGLALVVVSCIALSQLSFDSNASNIGHDLFDLRYFSHQILATTDLVAKTSFEVMP